MDLNFKINEKDPLNIGGTGIFEFINEYTIHQ